MSRVPMLDATAQVLAARTQWRWTGATRPPFASPPGPGEESVWDFPRPPVIEPVEATIRVSCKGQTIAESGRGVRVLETASAPTYYFPPADVDTARLEFGEHTSVCEWKGMAQAIHVDDQRDAGWRYVRMFAEFVALYEWVSFYPGLLECLVGDERAEAQPGGFYGGWVTRNLAGPIKGGPGSAGW